MRWREQTLIYVCVATLAACGGGGSATDGGSGVPKCVPGDSKFCAGPGGCVGYQICNSQGSYDTCMCNTGGSGGTGGGVAGSGGSSGTGGAGGGGGAGRSGTGGYPSYCTGSAGQDGGLAGDAGQDGAAGGSGSADAGIDGLSSDGPSSDPQFLTFCHAARAAMVSRNMRCLQYTRAQAESVVSIDPCFAWGGDLNSGYMSFDATNASACASDLQTQSCAVQTPPASCNGVLAGNVVNYAGLGTPGLGSGFCRFVTQLTLLGNTQPAVSVLFTECLPGSLCVIHQPAEQAGVCHPADQLGSACTGDPLPFTNRCAAGLTCDHTGHCAAPAAQGAACAADSDCSQGSYCRSDSTCQPVHATGACSAASECLPPATCRSGTCNVQPPGSSCVPMPDTPVSKVDQRSTCNPGEYCGMDSVCHAWPVVGQPCYYNPGALVCPESYFCLTGYCFGTATAMSCVTSASGGFCAQNADCGPNDACVLATTGTSFACQ